MDFSIKELVEQAVQTEKLGYEFYTAMALKFERDEKLRELFETLAVKEQQHERMFLELSEQLEYDIPEDWEETSKYLRAIVESEFFLGNEASLPPLEHITSVEEAINVAISFEKDTLLYFHSLRETVREKDLIDAIISEERSHINWLVEFRKTLR